jgi:hypothetical protein
MQQIVIGKECKVDFRRSTRAAPITPPSSRTWTAPSADWSRCTAIATPGPPSRCRFGAAPTNAAIQRATAIPAAKAPIRPSTKINPRDPHKGQWGDRPADNGWTASAKVTAIEQDWYEIRDDGDRGSKPVVRCFRVELRWLR